MLAARTARLFAIASLLGCAPTPTPTPAEPNDVAGAPPLHDGDGARMSVAQPRDAGASAYDRVIADLVGECEAVRESTGSIPPPHVGDRRADLNGDGEDEAIINVSCEDLSMWRVLTRHGDEAVALLESFETDTTLEITRGPDGRVLVISEHDCCCMYQLRVYAMRDDALETLYAFDSGCGPGCDTSEGYQAQVVADAEALTSIAVPIGECGADGSASIDLANWTVEP